MTSFYYMLEATKREHKIKQLQLHLDCTFVAETVCGVTARLRHLFREQLYMISFYITLYKVIKFLLIVTVILIFVFSMLFNKCLESSMLRRW